MSAVWVFRYNIALALSKLPNLVEHKTNSINRTVVQEVSPIMPFNPEIIIALDHETDTDALLFVAKLSPQHCRLKVGKYLFVRYGSEFVKKLIDMGFDVFLFPGGFNCCCFDIECLIMLRNFFFRSS